MKNILYPTGWWSISLGHHDILQIHLSRRGPGCWQQHDWHSKGVSGSQWLPGSTLDPLNPHATKFEKWMQTLFPSCDIWNTLQFSWCHPLLSHCSVPHPQNNIIPMDTLLITAPLLSTPDSYIPGPSCSSTHLACLFRWRLKQMHPNSQRET